MRRRQVSRTQATSSLPRSTLTRRTAVSTSVVAKSYFLPSSLPGCQLWLDATDNSSLVMDGTNVTTWRDKSGNGYHMNTLTPTAAWTGSAVYPTIGTSINGLQTVNFIPQSGLKQSTTLDGVKNLFWVGRIAAPVGTGDQSWFLLGHDTDYNWHGYPYGGKFIDDRFAQSGIYNASPASLFTNDPNAITNATFKNVNMPSPPNVFLLSVAGITGTTRYQGICYDRNANPGWCGDLAEVIIFNSALTTAQRQAVEGYLAHKWGINKYYSPTFPLSIPGCQLWLDAGDSSTVTGTTTVTQWRDKSGNGRHLGVGAGTTSYSSNAIQLNSSYMFVDSLVDLSKHNMFIVAKGTGQFGKAIFTAKPLFNVSWNSLDAFGFYLYTSDGAAYFANNVNDNGVGFSANTTITQVYSCQTSGTLSSGWVNGIGQTNRTLNATRTTTARGFAIGAEYYNNMHNNSGANASIYEILVYNSDFSIAQRETIEKYLMQKWGLSGLSLTHPYYNFMPSPLISGCQLWLDAADTSNFTLSGSNVTQIKDKSINSYTFTGSAGTYPTQTATMNGRPVISSANGKYLRTTNFNQNFLTASVFFVMRPTEDLSTSALTFPTYSIISGTRTGIIEIGSTYWLGGNYPFVYQSGYGFLGANEIGFNPLNKTLLVTGIVAGTAVTNYMYINGSLNRNGGENGTFAQLLSPQNLECIGDSGNSFGYDFAEILIFGTVVPNGQRQQVEGYLAHKWGLISSLPNTHPYKSLSPSFSISNNFVPSLIPGCALWLDAADASTITGTTTVTEWRDKSGNSRHLGVGAGTTSYSSNAIQLNSSYMFVDSLVDLSKHSVFIVVKGTGQFNKTVFNAKPLFNVSWNSLDAFGFYLYTSNAAAFFANTVNDADVTLNANTTITQLYSCQTNETSSSGWVNGVSQTVRTLSATRTTTARGFAIGAEYYSNMHNNSGAIASIYEIVVFNSALSTNDRQQVESYLAYKWGIQSTLPADHAYKTAPPSV